MKKTLLILSLLFFGAYSTFAQKIPVQSNFSLTAPVVKTQNKKLVKYEITPPNLQQIAQENAIRDRNGQFYRIGITTPTNYTTLNSGTWEETPNGDRVWRMRIHAQGAKALTVFFENFKIYGNSEIQVFDINGNPLSTALTTADNVETGAQNIALILSDDIIVQLIEPKGVTPTSFTIYEVGYAYRGVNEFQAKNYNDSDPCQNDINSSVGNGWQDEKKGVARILAKEGNQQGWCSGSLVNNTSEDCKPYFLTALHCGVNSSTADFNQWKFFFNFEKPTYTSDNVYNNSDPNTIIGCVFKASSKDGGGANGSDFLLVQLGSTSNEATIVNRLKNTIGAYWNGWNANNTASPSGASIHHPSGDVKKISLYSQTLQTTQWNGNGLQSHWYVKWSNGVTEGGSSGSPIFNNNHLIVGTLTGGSSYCSAPSSPDMYGKMSYHWDQNTTSGHIDLKTILDPGNTGTKILNGSYDPCTVVTAPPVANFNVSQTTIPVNTTLTFNNTSTNNPTTNTWTITPATGWSYAGGTNGSSKNPQVKFTAVGVYSVKLQASNSFGSDTKIENSYINVTQNSGPCAANTDNCDEYIAQVVLSQGQTALINNSTGCSNYIKYNAPAPTIQKGSSYNLGLLPGVVSGQAGNFYPDDIMSAWIDYNGDGQFTSNERVYNLQLSGSTQQSDLTQSFTIPASAVSGETVLRIRIDYQSMDPCGTSDYGEVEDYKIFIGGTQTPTPTPPTANFTADQTTVPVNTVVNFTNSSTNNPTSYSWDITPATGWSYSGGTNASSKNIKVQFTAVGAYTVKMTATNADGSDTRTRPSYINVIDDGTAVDELNEIQNLNIYPNPTSQWVNFFTTSTNESDAYQIQIVDLTGKVVIDTETPQLNQFQLNVERLTTGMYQMIIRQGEHFSKRKFIKE